MGGRERMEWGRKGWEGEREGVREEEGRDTIPCK